MFEWTIVFFALIFIYFIMKTPKTPTEKLTPKAKTDQLVETVVTESKSKKSSSTQNIPKKAKAVEAKPVVSTAEMTQSDRVGLTAGSIWHYLSEHGASSVAKLVRELSEEEKIIQRSIGWLAQEGKITLDTIDRAEIIALK